MKKWLTKKSNILTLFIVAFVLWRQFPNVVRNLKMEGQKLTPQSYKVIAPGPLRQVTFPPVQNSIAIFWATWCGPCKVEMERLQSSVANGKISQDRIFAINPFESVAEVKKFLSKNTYHFTFIDGPGISRDLQIHLTPTTLFMKGDEISSMSSGMSLIGIWKAEWFVSP